MGFFDNFRKKQPQSLYDQLQEVAKPLIVSRFRHFGAEGNCAPTSKISDQKIFEIYEQVGKAFKQASKVRNEHLSAGHLNTIVFKFYQVYELMGESMFIEHLKYEVDKYIQSGLRPDYKKDLDLF